MERKIFNVNYDEGISSGYEDRIYVNKYKKSYFIFYFCCRWINLESFEVLQIN
jgi:hypothetical protein